MGRELGRISGPLLADNLKRNGTNLTFETRLLYLNVTGTRIGVNTLAPAYELDVNNSFRTANLNVATQASIANLELYTNNIQNVIGNIVISPNQASNPTIVVTQLQATNLLFSGNTLSDTVTNADIDISLAIGGTTGQIKLNSNTLVDADLHATGDVTWDGNITLGDNQAQDTVFFGAQISSNIVPDAITYDLGNNTTPLKWATVYVNTTAATVTGIVDVTTTTLTGSGTNLLNGNVVIGTNGSNTLTIAARINSHLIPSITNTYTLGSATGPKYWNNVYGVTFNNSNIAVSSNIIQTNTTNSSLRLIANGSGQVVFSKLAVTNNVTVGGTLGVTGTSTLTNTTTGAITQTGDYNLTGDTGITGNLSSVNITQLAGGVGSLFFQLPGVIITNSNINGTAANTDLQITANGSGKILISTDDVQLDQNLIVGQALTVTGTSTLTNTNAGVVTLAGDYSQTGNFVTTGTISSASITTANPLTLPNITIDGTIITGTVANTPLTLTPYTGKVVQITRSALVDQNLTVGQTLSVVNTTSLTNTSAGAITLTGDYNQTGNFVTTGTISSGAIAATNPFILPGLTFNVSTITGTLSSSDLILTPKAGQQVKLTSSGKVTGDLSVGQTLTVGNTSTLTNTTAGVITLVGNYIQTGDFVTTGTINSGSITAANPLTLPNITINVSTITGTVANTNLTLTPTVGFTVDINGTVGTTTEVNQNLTVGGTFTVNNGSAFANTTTGAIALVGNFNQTGNFVTTGAISSASITAANPLTLPNVTINGSVITGTVASTDLTLTPYSGQVVDITSNARIDNNLIVTGTLGVISASTLTNTNAGTIALVGNFNQTGNFVTTGAISSASITAANPLTLSTLTLDGSIITGTANSNLTLTPNTGQLVKITSSAKINNNLNVLGAVTIVSTSALTNTSATTVTLVGNYNQTGNFTTLGAVTSGSVTSSGPFVMPSLIISGTPGSPITASSSIVGVNTNTDLVITPFVGNIVEITSNATIDQNLTVGGTLTVGSASTLTNTSTGAITQTGDYNLTGNASITGNKSGVNITLIDNGSSAYLQLPNVTISGSTIAGTSTNSYLRLTANGTGKILVPSNNVRFEQNLTVGGTFTETNAVNFVNPVVGSITQTGNFNQTGNTSINTILSPVTKTYEQPQLPVSARIDVYPNTVGIFVGMTTNLPSTGQFGQTPSVTSVVSFGYDYVILDKVVDVSFTGASITFTPSGPGTVSANNLILNGLTSILDIGNLRISGQTITSKITTLTLDNPSFTLDSDTITLATDGSVTLRGNGTGAVWIDGYLKISGNRLINNWINASVPYTAEDLQIFVSEDNVTLYTELGAPSELQNSINLVPTGTGNVIVNSTKAIKLPAGNDSNVPLADNGDIRFNNINSNFEGYKNTGYVSFIKLYSQNYTTYVTPELTPGAGDNLLRFGIAGNITTTISSTTVTSNRLTSGNITVNSNTIQNTDPSTAVDFATSGTGLVKFNSVNFVNGNNFNVPTSGSITFASASQGYVKFAGTTGLVLPSGTSSNYPSGPELGTVRFRTTDSVLQIYNGTNWVNSNGADNLTLDDIADLVQVYTIILGF